MKPNHQTWLQQTANALTGIISDDAQTKLKAAAVHIDRLEDRLADRTSERDLAEARCQHLGDAVAEARDRHHELEDTVKHQNKTILMQQRHIASNHAGELRNLVLRAFYDDDAQLADEWKQEVRELLAPHEGAI